MLHSDVWEHDRDAKKKTDNELSHGLLHANRFQFYGMILCIWGLYLMEN